MRPDSIDRPMPSVIDAPILFGNHFDRLHAATVVLSARARKHQVRGYPGPLSVKTVLRGQACWQVSGQRYTVDRNSCLLVDRDEPYDMDLDSDTPVETLVVFFADALAGDVADTRLSGLEQLLDAGGCARGTRLLPVQRRLWSSDSVLGQALGRLRRADPAASGAADLNLRALLDACADLAAVETRERNRIAAARASTRAELHRRVLLGKALVDETLALRTWPAWPGKPACRSTTSTAPSAPCSARHRTAISCAGASNARSACCWKPMPTWWMSATGWATRACPRSPRASSAPPAPARRLGGRKFASADKPPAAPAATLVVERCPRSFHVRILDDRRARGRRACRAESCRSQPRPAGTA
jgi:hypothetical protein